MKKKTLGLWLASSICAASLVGAVGCGGVNSPEFKPSYTGHWSGAHDYNIQFDGVLDEDVWQDKGWYRDTFASNYSGTMPYLHVTAFTGEHGVYIAAIAYDNNLCYNGHSFNASYNSTFEFYIMAEEVGEERDEEILDRHTINIDLSGATHGSITASKRGVSVDEGTGALNQQNTVSATLELFVPWEVLDIQKTNGTPETFAMYSTYYAMLAGQSSTKVLFPGLHSPVGHPLNYFEYGPTGYLDADKEDALLGDSKNGRAKSANWDVSKADEGEVSRVGGLEWQHIFFREAYDEAFEVSTTIYPEGPVSSDPKYGGQYAGLLFMTDEGYYYASLLDCRSVYLLPDRANLSNYSLVTIHNYPSGWNQQGKKQAENPNAQTQEGVEMRIVKSGGELHYFMNGEYFYSEKYDFLNAKLYVGLYSLNENATFKNCSYTVYTQEEVEAVLADEGIYSTSAAVGSAGGEVTMQETSVLAGGSATFTILPRTGYVVSSIKINGVEKLTEVTAAAVDGTYTVENIQQALSVIVKFKKLQQGEFVTLGGKVTLDGEAQAVTVLLQNVNDPLVRYQVIATIKNGYSVNLPAGSYRITTTMEGAQGYDQTVAVAADKTHDIALEPSAFPSTIIVNKKAVSSDLTAWNFDQEPQGKILTKWQRKMNPLWFDTLVTGSAIAQATVEYTGGFAQPDGLFGFMVTDGESRAWIVARMTGAVYTSTKWSDPWSNILSGVLSTPVLTPEHPEAVTVKLVRHEGNFYFFVNDTLVVSMFGTDFAETFTGANREYAFGLYQISDQESEFTVTNYGVRTDAAAVSEIQSLIAGKSSVAVNATLTNRDAGLVFVSANRVWSGQSATVEVVTKSGYDLTSIKINGTEKLAQLKTSAVAGKFTLTNITANTNIVIEHTAISSPITYKGATVFNGEKVPAQMTLVSSTNAMLKYSKYSTANGFEFKLPAGQYAMTVSEDAYMTIKKTMNFTADLNQDVVLGMTAFGNVTVNGKTLQSKLDRWNLEDEYDKKVKGSFALNTKTVPLWFNAVTGQKAVLSVDIEYTAGFEQTDLFAGFAFTDGSKTGFIAAHNKGIVYDPDNAYPWTFKDTLLTNAILTPSNPAKINFTVALSENILFVHINGEHVYSVLVPEVVQDYDGGDLGFGLFMITDKAAEATFSNWSVLVGDEADTALEELVVFETVDYLFLGDSYIDLAFWKSYAAEFTSLSAANGGIGGTKTPYWTEQATSLSALYNPKNIIFHVGINDINGDDVTYEQLVTRMDTMFAAYKAAFPGANLYWITIAPNNFKLSTYVDQWEISSQINAYMKTKDGVNVIDVASKIGTQAGEGVAKYYINDGLHFNELGYNKFVGAIKETFGLTQYAWQAKDMKYDHTANKITNLNTGTGASFMYLNHNKSGIVYIKTRVYGKTSDMLAGVTVSDGTYSSQIYLQNYGIARLTNYAWSDCQWNLANGETTPLIFYYNNYSDAHVANGVMFHRTERVAKGAAGNVYAAGGYFDMEVYIADGYVYIFTDGLLNLKLPIAQINSQFNLADTFRLGVVVWDGKSVAVEFHNTQVLANNQAMAAVEGRI